jgi:hypothetical protein
MRKLEIRFLCSILIFSELKSGAPSPAAGSLDSAVADPACGSIA